MLARLHRERLGARTRASTLIELLVVMIIIGILAASAVPVSSPSAAKGARPRPPSPTSHVVGRRWRPLLRRQTPPSCSALATEPCQFSQICTDITCSDAAHTITTDEAVQRQCRKTGTAGREDADDDHDDEELDEGEALVLAPRRPVEASEHELSLGGIGAAHSYESRPDDSRCIGDPRPALERDRRICRDRCVRDRCTANRCAGSRTRQVIT